MGDAMTKRKFEPLQFAGCYSLDLYCDVQNGAENCGHSDFENKSETFTGETYGECAKEARAAGWKIHSATRTATCPQCLSKMKKAKRVIAATV